MKLAYLFWLISKFLNLGAEDGEEVEAAAEEASTGDETLDDLIDIAEPEQAASAEDKPDPVRAERTRSALLEEQLGTERARREQAEAFARQNAPQQRDPVFDQEEAEIAAARAKGEDTSWLQWKIDGNRKLRSSERNSQFALLQAQDTRDQTAFERLEITKPKVYKTYGDRVEKELTRLRQTGQNASRLAILRYLMGDDLINGKLKAGKVGKAKTDDTVTRVDRGRVSTPRSDVSARRGSSEHQKRMARLADQPI